MEGKGKPPSVPAVGNPVLQDKCLLVFDNVLRHIPAQSRVYQKMPFIMLAQSVANDVGYSCRIAECVVRPGCGAKGIVGNDVVQRGWEGVNWTVGGEYRSVWTVLWGEG